MRNSTSDASSSSSSSAPRLPLHCLLEALIRRSNDPLNGIFSCLSYPSISVSALSYSIHFRDPKMPLMAAINSILCSPGRFIIPPPFCYRVLPDSGKEEITQQTKERAGRETFPIGIFGPRNCPPKEKDR